MIFLTAAPTFDPDLWHNQPAEIAGTSRRAAKPVITGGQANERGNGSVCGLRLGSGLALHQLGRMPPTGQKATSAYREGGTGTGVVPPAPAKGL